MARAPDPRADQAKELFLSGKKLIEISELLNIPEGTIRSWKNRYRWDSANATLQKSKRNVAKAKGGQPGNRNAVGNKGGAAPEQNKNAVKTGEFETLFFDVLDPEEQNLISMVQPDKEELLLQEIQLLTVRERRMLKRIEAIKDAVESVDDKVVDGMTAVKIQIGVEKGKMTDLKEYQGKMGQIQSIEDALTRVQARRQHAIGMLHRFGMDDAKMELELMRVELEIARRDPSGTEVADDGFLDALNAGASELWGGKDGDA